MSEFAGASGFDRQQQLDNLEEYHRSGGLVPEHPELVATRGDDLCLIRSNTVVGDDEIPYLAITEIDGDRVLRTVTFEPDQLEAALDELDRRWVELGASPPPL